MIADELIEQVRDSADLVEIVGEAVSLKRTGADWRGPCPFHGGTHRNFAVVPKKGLYYCYVCHAAGDVFTFLMKRFGMDYPTAVREAARRVGIVIPDQGAREGPDPREPLYGAMAVAQEWFATRLREGADAEQARTYLESRELPLTVAAEWGLGFAPRDRAFVDAMRQLGLDERVMLEVGLLVRRDDGTTVPRFRGRLLFPIRDQRGRVVAFGGRILGAGEPKYLNSPESPIFHKGTGLYNLHQAKHAIRKDGHAIVVEGYFDVIRLVEAGIESVVAPLGTALTADQATLLRRFAPTVILLYDSDAAGLRATFRAGDECLRNGLRVRVATMPEGEDPDTLVRNGGAAALGKILDDAVDVLERKIQLLERRGWFEGVERRRDALDRLLPTIRAASDPIARDLYIGRVAERVGLTRAVLEQELTAAPRSSAPRQPVRPAPPSVDRRPARSEGRPTGARSEGVLLQLMIHDASWRARATRELTPDRFKVETYRQIFERLTALGETSPASDALAELSPRAAAAWQKLAEAAIGLEGQELDTVYAAELTRLDDRDGYFALPPTTDITARTVSKQQLSPTAKARFPWEKQKANSPSRPPDARREG
ncbi:MAG: DNA primase [Gemmatimonadales bacterium]|nr:DNA primase [Gemmatimonadales bacterium]